MELKSGVIPGVWMQPNAIDNRQSYINGVIASCKVDARWTYDLALNEGFALDDGMRGKRKII
jgi:hypothetical protein